MQIPSKEKNNLDSSLLWSLSGYLRRPYFEVKEHRLSFFKKLFDVLKLWSLGIVIAFIAAYLSSIFMESAGLDDSQNLLEDFFENSSVITIILLVFLWGPITEELTFRLFLRFSPYKLGFFLSFFLFLIAELFISENTFFNGLIEKMFDTIGLLYSFISLIILIVFFGLFFSWIIKLSKRTSEIQVFYKKYFAYIFYASSLTFAFIHFYNYENFADLWLGLPLLVAPQLLLGLILAYTRMFYGFGWAIFFHSFHNGIASLPPLLFTQVSDNSMEIISSAVEGESLDIPTLEKTYYALGMISALLMILMVLVFFFLLLRNHYKFLKQKNVITPKN